MKETDAKNLSSDKVSDTQEFSALIKFLELTKDGTYSEIEKRTLENHRLNIDVETIDTEENYFYSIS